MASQPRAGGPGRPGGDLNPGSTKQGPQQVLALIHVHTMASDGHGGPEQIARAAAARGLEVVILSDHDRLSPGEGYHHGVLLLAGQEASLPGQHLLVLGLERDLPEFPALSSEQVVAEARAAGAWTALAHPLDPGRPLAQECYACQDFAHLDYHGLEVWNLLSAFKRNLENRRRGLAMLLWPRAALAAPDPLALALWDSLGRRRPVMAFGGADAHAYPLYHRLLPMRLYSYRRHCGLLLTGLWLSEPLSGQVPRDRALVIEALRRGRAFASLGAARGFACRLKGPGGRELLPGAEEAFAPNWRLVCRLPARGQVRLLCNGALEAQARGRLLEHELDRPGVWRVEARRWRLPRGWRSWIYCNPFYLREPDFRPPPPGQGPGPP